MRIVLLQIAYLCIALCFNALSAGLALAGSKPLAPTNLVAATGVFALYALTLWSGHAGFDTAYRAAMLCFVLVPNLFMRILILIPLVHLWKQ